MSNRIYGGDPDYHRDLPAHQWHSDTSTEAAEAIAPKINTMVNKIFDLIGSKGGYGLTDDEGIVQTGMDGNSYRPCRIDLMNRGLVDDAGLRRPTRRGRNAVVWELTELGKRIYEEGLKRGQP